MVLWKVLFVGKQGKSGVEKMSEERVEVVFSLRQEGERGRRRRNTIDQQSIVSFPLSSLFLYASHPHDPASGSAAPLLCSRGRGEAKIKRNEKRETFSSLRASSLSPTIGRRSVFFFLHQPLASLFLAHSVLVQASTSHRREHRGLTRRHRGEERAQMEHRKAGREAREVAPVGLAIDAIDRSKQTKKTLSPRFKNSFVFFARPAAGPLFFLPKTHVYRFM